MRGRNDAGCCFPRRDGRVFRSGRVCRRACRMTTPSGNPLNLVPPPDPVFPEPAPPTPASHLEPNWTEPDRGGNFIARHWRGGYSLPVAYWLVGFLVSIASLVILKTLGPVLTTNLDYDPTRIFAELMLVWIAIVAVTTWQLVGIWRSATHYAARRRRGGRNTFWGVLAKIAVVLGVLNSVVQFARAGTPQLSETFKMAFMGDPKMPAYFLRVMRDNSEIEITGGLKFGLTEDFEKTLREFPRIHVVHLNSVGGRIGEAAKLYHAIKDRGLITYVDAACLSACTLAYAAGRERWIAPTGQLGFHGPAFPGFSAANLASAVTMQKGLMVASGFDPAFVDRALAVPDTQIWQPTLQELTNARVVTAVANGGQFAISGFAPGITAEQMGEQYARYLPVLTAMQARLPDDYRSITKVLFDDYTTGATRDAVVADARRQLMPLIARYRSLADNDVLIDVATLIIDQYTALNQRDPALCYQFASAGINAAVQKQIPAALVQRELALERRIIETAARRAPVDEQQMKALWRVVGISLTASFSRDKIAIVGSPHVAPEQYADYCAVTSGVLRAIVALPPTDAGIVLRNMFAAKN
jgi:hypothetical protein